MRSLVLIIVVLSSVTYCSHNNFSNKIISDVPESSFQESKLLFSPHFIIFLDAVTLIHSYALSGNFDIDLFRIHPQNKINFGLRNSIEYYSNLSLGGSTGGEPFVNYNLLIRLSIKNNNSIFDIYAGLNYHTTSMPLVYESSFLPKIGLEFRLAVIKKTTYLLAKANTSFTEDTSIIGLGISIGINN
jgi:hypothetical protein